MKLCGSGCGSKIPDTAKRCDACERERNGAGDGIKTHVPVGNDGMRSHTSGYDERLDKLRKSARWQKQRASVLSTSPVCADCKAHVAEIVDHIVPAPYAIAQAKESKRWLFDPDAGFFLKINLQGLCRPCHGAKTERDKAHVGPWPNVVEAYDAAPKKKWTF